MCVKGSVSNTENEPFETDEKHVPDRRTDRVKHNKRQEILWKNIFRKKLLSLSVHETADRKKHASPSPPS